MKQIIAIIIGALVVALFFSWAFKDLSEKQVIILLASMYLATKFSKVFDN